eukprot:2520963-Amphidinium_carterae.1
MAKMGQYLKKKRKTHALVRASWSWYHSSRLRGWDSLGDGMDPELKRELPRLKLPEDLDSATRAQRQEQKQMRQGGSSKCAESGFISVGWKSPLLKQPAF